MSATVDVHAGLSGDVKLQIAKLKSRGDKVREYKALASRQKQVPRLCVLPTQADLLRCSLVRPSQAMRDQQITIETLTARIKGA